MYKIQNNKIINNIIGYILDSLTTNCVHSQRAKIDINPTNIIKYLNEKNIIEKINNGAKMRPDMIQVFSTINPLINLFDLLLSTKSSITTLILK